MNPLNIQTNTLYLVFPKEANQTLLNAILAQYPNIESEKRIKYTHRKNESDVIAVEFGQESTYFGEEYAILETWASEVTPDVIRSAIGLLTYFPFEVSEIYEYFY